MEKLLIKRTINSIGYSSFARIATFLLQVITSIILAQNLASRDYGVVGFALIIIGFLARFSDFGITSAVVQKIEIDQRSLYTGFTLRIFLGVVMFLLCIAMAPVAKLFFDDPAIGIVIRVLAANFVISGFSFLPNTTLTRNIEFKTLSMASLIAAIVRSTLCITLVLAGFQYWSLVWGEIGATLATAITLNYLCPMKPWIELDRKTAVDFMRFGGRLLLTGLVIFSILNADNLLIGAVGGASMLGFYALAFNWGSMACGILEETVHNVLFPTFSKIQKDKDGIRNAYLKVLEYVSTIGVMANVTLMVNAREILTFVLGRGTDKWVPALWALKILCIYGISRIILVPVGNVVLALGKPGILLKANLLAGIIEIGLLYPAMKYGGINAVAILVASAYASQYFIFLPFLKKYCGITVAELFNVLKPSIFSGAAVILGALVLDGQLQFSIASMLVKIPYCMLGYFILHGLITKWRILREARMILSMFYSR